MTLYITVEPENETLFNNLGCCEVELEADFESEPADDSVGFGSSFYVGAYNYDNSKYSLAEIEEIENAIAHRKKALENIVFYMYENDFDNENDMRRYNAHLPSYQYKKPRYA